MKRLLILLAIIATFASYHIASAEDYDKIYAAHNGVSIFIADARYGYMTIDGEVLFPAVFNDVSPFICGLAIVKQGNKYGLISIQGSTVVECTFDSIQYSEEHEDDHLLIVTQSERYGVMTASGDMITAIVFENISGFINGYAIVTMNGAAGLIDTTGTVRITPEWDWLYYPDENGWCLACMDDTVPQYMYINMDGRTIGPYEYAEPYSEGFAFVISDGIETVINDTGGVVLTSDGTVDAMHSAYSGGLMGVLIHGDWGYVDYSGNICITPQWAEVGTFSDNGLAMATLNGISYGYINKNGEWIIEPIWTDAYDFVKGYAIVEAESGTGLIDEHGNIIIQPIWAGVDYPAEGMVGISTDDWLYGYMNLEGDWVIEPKYEYAEWFSNGIARVYASDTETYIWINRSGEVVCP